MSVADLRFSPPPPCPTCDDLGYTGTGSCPDCQFGAHLREYEQAMGARPSWWPHA